MEEPEATPSAEQDDLTIAAEIRWLLKILQDRLPLKINDCADGLFQNMFPDSAIAQEFSLDKTKASIVFDYGIADYVRDTMIRDMEDIEWFVVYFFESEPLELEKYQMDIILRFWSEQAVHTKYWTTVFIETKSVKHFVDAFLAGLEDLNTDKILQVLVNSPNLSKYFVRLLRRELRLSRNPDFALLDMGLCIRKAMNKALLNSDIHSYANYDILKQLYDFFKNSRARRLYTRCTGSTDFPLKCSRTQWADNGPCLDRAIEVVDNLEMLFETFPNNADIQKLKRDTSVPLLKAQWAALRHVIFICNGFNFWRFQRCMPMTPLLYSSIILLLRYLMSKCMREDKIKIETTEELTIDALSLDELQNTTDDIDIGEEAQRLFDAETHSGAVVEVFKDRYRNFIRRLIMQILDGFPIQSPLVMGMSCFDPYIVHRAPNTVFYRLLILLQVMRKSNKILGFSEANVKKQFPRFVNEVQNIWSSEFEKFQPNINDLFKFYYKLIGEDQGFSDLWKLIKICLITSYCVDFEDAYEINEYLKNEDLPENSVVAQRIVYTALLEVGGANKFPISPTLIEYVRNAESKFEECMGSQSDED